MPARARAHPATDALLFGTDFLEALHAHPDSSVDGSIDSSVCGSVVEVFHTLHTQFQGRRLPLQLLDATLHDLHDLHGSSMAVFAQVIKSQGICLGTGEAFGSPERLRVMLRRHFKTMMVPLKAAKKYEYLKKCLIEL